MQKRKSDQKGFTLIEVIVTLVLVGITATLAGMWIVSVVNGYIFTKTNASTVQKAQLAMTRLTKEFSAISSVDVSLSDDTSITYTRVDSITVTPGIPPVVTPRTLTVSGTTPGFLKLGNETLTDSVSAFSLKYCDDASAICPSPSVWSSTSRIIEITLTLTAGSNTPVAFVQRVIPRNI